MANKDYFVIKRSQLKACPDVYLRERSWRGGYIAETPSKEEVDVFRRPKKLRKVPPMRGC